MGGGTTGGTSSGSLLSTTGGGEGKSAGASWVGGGGEGRVSTARGIPKSKLCSFPPTSKVTLMVEGGGCCWERISWGSCDLFIRFRGRRWGIDFCFDWWWLLFGRIGGRFGL